MSGPNCYLFLRPMVARNLLNPIVPLLTSSTRSISTSDVDFGRRNFRKFPIPNKRGIFEHAKLPKPFLEEEYKDQVVVMDDLRIRYPGVWFAKKFVYVREMEPELIVPADFEDCPLKPYVSYRADEITQSEFTTDQLFAATYGQKIKKMKNNNEPIPEGYLDYDENAAKEAKNRALKIGSDVFSHTSYFGSLDEDWRYGHN